MQKDYYKILGVSKNASEEEIKKAYHRLAHQYHPDKAGGDEKKFKEISEAYQILSNKEKRVQYDRFGQVFSEAGGGGGPAYGWEGFGPDVFWQGGGFEPSGDWGDLFESIFENLGVSPRRTYTHGSDIEIKQEIDLKDVLKGLKLHLSFSTYVPCQSCQGQGYDKTKGFSSCLTCGGRGKIRENRQTFFGNFSQVKTCPQCQGLGQIPNKVCSICSGKGRIKGEKEVVVDVAPGIENGQVIKIKGAGEAGERKSPAGDLYVVIKVRPHPSFERKGADLFTIKEIKLSDLLLRKEIFCFDLNGDKFNVQIPAGFNVREKLRIPGQGLPRFGSFGRGDLYLSFNLKLPKKFSPKARKIIQDLEEELNSED